MGTHPSSCCRAEALPARVATMADPPREDWLKARDWLMNGKVTRTSAKAPCLADLTKEFELYTYLKEGTELCRMNGLVTRGRLPGPLYRVYRGTVYRTNNISTLEERNIKRFLNHVETELKIKRAEVFKGKDEQEALLRCLETWENHATEPSAGMEECGGPRGAWGFTEKLFSGIPILRCLGPSKNHATEMTSSDDILVEPPNKRICMKSSKNDDDKGDPEGDFALALAEKHMQKDGGRSKIEEVLPPRAPETINGNDVKEWVGLYEEMLALEGDGTAMEKLNNELTALDYYDPKLLTKLEAIKELKLKF